MHISFCLNIFFWLFDPSLCPSIKIRAYKDISKELFIYFTFKLIFILISSFMDELELTGRNQVHVFIYRLRHACIFCATTCTTKWPNLKLKTWSKQLFGYLPLAFPFFGKKVISMIVSGPTPQLTDNVVLLWTQNTTAYQCSTGATYSFRVNLSFKNCNIMPRLKGSSVTLNH
jgi:hypothetical protein